MIVIVKTNEKDTKAIQSDFLTVHKEQQQQHLHPTKQHKVLLKPNRSVAPSLEKRKQTESVLWTLTAAALQRDKFNEQRCRDPDKSLSDSTHHSFNLIQQVKFSKAPKYFKWFYSNWWDELEQ